MRAIPHDIERLRDPSIISALSFDHLSLASLNRRMFFSKHVFEVPMSFCVSRERTSGGGQLNACPLDCKNEPEVSVCGSDGSIYRNECEMQMLNCGCVYLSRGARRFCSPRFASRQLHVHIIAGRLVLAREITGRLTDRR